MYLPIQTLDDLAVRSSRPAGRGNLADRKRSSLTHNFSLLHSHCPDMAEIQLKRTKSRKALDSSNILAWHLYVRPLVSFKGTEACLLCHFFYLFNE